MNRTHTCGQLTINNLNEFVILQGWINKIRKMGKLIFIDLRDLYGITQLVFDSEKNENYKKLKNNYVVEVQGKVIERKSKNLNILTGEIEIQVTNLKIINESILLPFEIVDDTTAKEDIRLKYRYLDLRRPKMQQNLIFRSKLNQIIRNFLIDYNFIEIETPIFGKTTPEGARDYLVPSRLNKHKFYSLPQSPQLYKQLLMIAGMDRYFQIAKCFRDEDLRIDRQPEFTQLDLEMSFANSDDLMKIIELLFKKILKDLKNIDLTTPLQKLKWKQAIDFYGSDKPDLRYEMQIKTINEIFKNTNVSLFNNLEKKCIRAIYVETILTNKQLNQLIEVAKQNGGKQLFSIKYKNNQWIGSIASKLTDEEKKLLINEFNIKNIGTILFVIDNYLVASKIMGAVRMETAKLCNLIDNNKFCLLWIVDFPLYEFSEEENRYIAAHHPFTMPNEKFINDFDKNIEDSTAQSFDLVMNGFELGSGSQRIINKDIQMRMFKSLNINDEQIEQNFGWFLKAYEYGAPSHLGMALGLDRIIMILTNSKNIREVIAFPKNSSGFDPMSNAPSYIDNKQLDELNIKLK